jgi:hypothetical protein
MAAIDTKALPASVDYLSYPLSLYRSSHPVVADEPVDTNSQTVDARTLLPRNSS